MSRKYLMIETISYLCSFTIIFKHSTGLISKNVCLLDPHNKNKKKIHEKHQTKHLKIFHVDIFYDFQCFCKGKLYTFKFTATLNTIFIKHTHFPTFPFQKRVL